MSTFTIDPDNNITALVELPADADRSTTFSSEKELTKLIADWPISRLIVSVRPTQVRHERLSKWPG